MHLIPNPRAYQALDGAFTLQDGEKVKSELRIPLVRTTTREARIIVTRNPALQKEAYTLNVTPEKVHITAATPIGAYYALQSLRILADYDIGGRTVPCCSIHDAPRWGWRGMSLDEALVAHTANRVKKETVSLVKNGERHSFEVIETPFHAGQSLDKICTAGALIEVTELDELKRNLKLHQNAHLEILGALGTAFAVFDNGFRLSFYNKAFASFWGLEDVWLESNPTYASFLDVIREKRMLPEVPDFRLYKNDEQKDFSAIIEPKEDMLHLPDGRTFRRVRAPHPMGGLVFAFEDVSDRLATRRAYNSLLSVQQEILDNLFDPVLIFGSNGRLNFFNRAYLEMWEVDEIKLQNDPGIDEIIESQAKFFGNVDDWPLLKKDIIQHLTSLTTRSFSLKRSDGVSIEVLTTALSDGSIMITYKQI